MFGRDILHVLYSAARRVHIIIIRVTRVSPGPHIIIGRAPVTRFLQVRRALDTRAQTAAAAAVVVRFTPGVSRGGMLAGRVGI